MHGSGMWPSGVSVKEADTCADAWCLCVLVYDLVDDFHGDIQGYLME